MLEFHYFSINLCPFSVPGSNCRISHLRLVHFFFLFFFFFRNNWKLHYSYWSDYLPITLILKSFLSDSMHVEIILFFFLCGFLIKLHSQKNIVYFKHCKSILAMHLNKYLLFMVTLLIYRNYEENLAKIHLFRVTHFYNIIIL